MTWHRLAGLLLALLSLRAFAQDIEPRAYSNAPVDVNFFVAGMVRTQGALSFDAAVPVDNAKLDTTNLVLAYARVLDIGGKSGKFDIIVPYTHLQGTADYQGQPVSRDVFGFGRPALRLSVNFHGAPALALREFRDWKQDLIVGASLQVSPPWAQYDEHRIVNIGANRWTIKPEIGVSKAIGQWIVEGQAAVVFFTDNDDFYNGHSRSQDPICTLQGHLIHGFASGSWFALDATYFAGGRSDIDGERSNDLQQNWRVGGTLAIPMGRLHSLKFSASSGVSARTGNNFDAFGVAWQYRWGGGL